MTRPLKRWPSSATIPAFAYDSYRRLIQMFGDVVLDVPKKKFEHIFDTVKEREGVKFDYELSPTR
jgi:pyruvate,orthophosphate dikinase